MNNNTEDDHQLAKPVLSQTHGGATLSEKNSHTLLIPVSSEPKQIVTNANVKAFKKQPIVETEQSVLGEDIYTNALNKIIQRDFFPSLPKLRLQHALIEAQEKRDLVRVEELSQQLLKEQETSIDGKTSLAAPTPILETTAAYDHDILLSLDEFQHRYTSEDNASFNEILRKTNEKKRTRYSWLYNEQKKELLLEYRPILDHTLDHRGMIQTWQSRGPNSLMFHPKGQSLTVGDVFDAPARTICHQGTRSLLDEHPNRSSEVSRRDEDEMSTTTSNSTQADNYGFVAHTPTLVPGTDVAPLMTWGTIESTPLRLDASSETPYAQGPGFKMQPTPQRELIGMELSEKASKSYRKRNRLEKACDSLRREYETSQRSTDRLPLLSPAAQHLLKKSTSFLRGDLQLRESYGSSSNSKRFVPEATPAKTPNMPVTPQPKTTTEDKG